MAHETHAKTLPAELRRAGLCGRLAEARAGGRVGLLGDCRGLGLCGWARLRLDHVLRAWLLGMVLTFGFAVGGLALLMVQYVTGGKWGLLLRRPLEAMSRTLPLVFAYWLVVAFSLKKLYLWAAVEDVSAALQGGMDQRGAGARDRIQAANAES